MRCSQRYKCPDPGTPELCQIAQEINVNESDGIEWSERWKGRGLRYFLISCADWVDDEVLKHRFHRLCKVIEASPWVGSMNRMIRE